jgi:hypothetical protein
MSTRHQRQASLTPRERAFHIVDIISLTRDIQLAYIELGTHCLVPAMAVDPKDSANYPSGEDTDHGVQVDHRTGTVKVMTKRNTTTMVTRTLLTLRTPQRRRCRVTVNQRHILFRKWQQINHYQQLRLRQTLNNEDQVELFRARHGKL